MSDGLNTDTAMITPLHDTVKRASGSIAAVADLMLGLEPVAGLKIETQVLVDFTGRRVTRIAWFPKGALILGCRYKTSQRCVVFGDMEVWDGVEFMRLPPEGETMSVFESPAGVRRLGYAVSDVTWITTSPLPSGIGLGADLKTIEDALYMDPQNLQDRRWGIT